MVNKKYWFLDDKEWLKQQLMIKSMAELAAELAEQHGCEKVNLAGSIRFLVYRYFTKQERSMMKKQRAFHKNRKKSQDTEL